MANSSGNLCEVCNWPVAYGTCINQECPKNPNFVPAVTPFPPPISIGDEPFLGSDPPPRGDCLTPTVDIPPEIAVIRTLLGKGRRQSEIWPDKGRCEKPTCLSKLEADFLLCPYCGTKRKLSADVSTALHAYAQAVVQRSIPPLRVPTDRRFPSVAPPPQPETRTASGKMLPPPIPPDPSNRPAPRRTFDHRVEPSVDSKDDGKTHRFIDTEAIERRRKRKT